MNEPNSDLRDETIAPIEYESDDEDDDEAVMAAEEEIEVDVAIDSGAVDHVAGPKNIPQTVPVEAPQGEKKRNFVAANGNRMKNYGKAKVTVVQESGSRVGNTFQVTDVTRPLHSTSKICDADHEVLFTKGEATVVPDGVLSKFLDSIQAVAKYPRRGGLYVARMKARAPKAAAKQGFGRQGGKR